MEYSFQPVPSHAGRDWDQLISKCENTTAFQAWNWRTSLSEAFNQLQPHYFWILDSKKAVIGGWPTFIFRPLPTVKILFSLPWNLFGGYFLIPEFQGNYHQLCGDLMQQLTIITKKEKVCQTSFTLDWNQSLFGDYLLEKGFKSDRRYFTHRLKIGPDYDQIWNSYNKRVRGAVRKSQKKGVEVYETDNSNQLDQFYQIYLQTQQRLGGTPKPFSLMTQLFESNLAKLVVARQEGKTIAGLLYFYFNTTVTLWAGASDPDWWSFRPNNAIFDHIIRWSCNSGYEWVDFGASPPDNTGLIKHKEEYRAVPHYFQTYTKVNLPLQLKLWQTSEPAIRKVYAFLQQIGH